MFTTFRNFMLRKSSLIFFTISAIVVAAFLYFSSLLVKDLSEQERQRMQIWADATRELAMSATSDIDQAHIEFLWGIIEGNHSIPVLLTDSADNIITYRNFDLPEPVDSLATVDDLSPANMRFLNDRIRDLKHTPNVIIIVVEPNITQHLYYEDSRLLRNLSLYPYIQLAVMAAFILVVYLAVTSSKKAEQNKVWVGLSKETAHQLGTPISSLMAWLQILESENVDPDVISEMDKDVKRLSTIASRFSKIGSNPAMEPGDVNAVVSDCVAYMRTRISSRVAVTIDLCPHPLMVNLSTPLIEWVMENLIKNAVDAMEGAGKIDIVTTATDTLAVVEITDTGKGIPRKHINQVFNPGYTTKKRGWGLGLTLAKRIINEYHAGKIMVKWSEPGRGSTFRIELPLINAVKS